MQANPFIGNNLCVRVSHQVLQLDFWKFFAFLWLFSSRPSLHRECFEGSRERKTTHVFSHIYNFRPYWAVSCFIVFPATLYSIASLLSLLWSCIVSCTIFEKQKIMFVLIFERDLAHFSTTNNHMIFSFCEGPKKRGNVRFLACMMKTFLQILWAALFNHALCQKRYCPLLMYDRHCIICDSVVCVIAKNYFWDITQSTEFCLVEISQFLSHFRTNIARAHINHVIFVLFRCVQCDGDIISHYFHVKIWKNKEILLF